ncbi:sensor histidine kinase [Blastococcus capsensis]|uniref:sensor histidine kinase n=1 Tax=Blastococcus capsensis TaxID=1564163 RepID=UPI002541E673|nr:ATP-binding protein [Blastococcus capsensis]MDK3255739.1 ATP-binding protein [Blastococcus capsensis]
MISRDRVRAAVRRLPLSVRLGTAFAFVFLGVLSVLVALAYWGLGMTLRAELDRALVDALSQVEEQRLSVTEIDERELGGVESSEIEIQLVDRSRIVLAATDDDLHVPLLSPARLAGVLEDGVLFVDAHDGEEPVRVLARPLSGSDGQVQVLAVEMDNLVESQAALLGLAGPLAALAGLLAGMTGWLVARRGLAPVTELAAQARDLNARDLSRRLELRRSESEIARLGQTLNEMLGRIEDARLRERQFTADASHELRTPLAILRAEVELARGRVGGDARLRESLDSALEECDRLTDLVDDLLQVARAEADRMDRTALVDVAEVVDGLLPRFAVLAGRRHVTLTRRGDAAVHADRRALGRALSNLVDNAIRHARPGGHVELAIAQSRTSVRVTVTDDGPGVDYAARGFATERFIQLDPSRSDAGGAGLGLAMVASIAAAHQGALELATPPTGNGLAATLRLPAPTDADPAR